MRFGIDLGGTKIEILALDDSGKELYRKRTDTPQNDYSATLDAINNLVVEAESNLDTEGTVGICTPGSLSPTSGLLRNSNSVCLNNQPFKEDLEALLQRDIRMSNDANCFALSEATDGAASTANIVFGVIIGTGCGGGIVINKHVIDGPNSIGGEWGHTPLPWPEDGEIKSARCWCGQYGCLETFISGSGLSRDYALLSNKKSTGKEIVSMALNGEKEANLALERYEKRLAKSLAVIINILDPEIIVLGGGMSNVSRLYHTVPKLWQDYVFSDTVLTQLVAPQYGDSSGVRGAAWLWN